MKKKIFAIFLSLVMVITMTPLSVFAEVEGTDYMSLKNYFYDITISMEKVGSGSLGKIVLEYSKDKENWQDFDSEVTSIKLAPTEQIFFRAKAGYSWPTQNSSNYWHFVMKGDGKVDAAGSVMSLIDQSLESKTISQPYTFYHLFDGCKPLMIPPLMPATKVANYAYAYMYKGCINLRSYEKIPAVTLGTGSMKGMFYGCESLTLARELQATTMTESAYEEMFANCKELVYPPKLPATKMAANCYKNMFNGCKMLLSAPFLPATQTATSCYESMFKNCVEMKEGPKVCATSLASKCCKEMLSGCIKLQFISVKFTSWGSLDATSNWVSGVYGQGGFLCPDSLTTPKDSSHLPCNFEKNNINIPKITSNYDYSGHPNSCTLEWEPLDYAHIKYYIYRGTSPSGDWGNPIDSTTDVTYTDKTVITDNVYYYMVRPAVEYDGQTFLGPYSNQDYGWPRVRDLKGFSCKATDVETVKLQWETGAEDEEYWIYRSTKPTGDFGSVYAKVTYYYRTGFTEKHPDVKPGTKYYYIVRGAIKGNDGKYHFGPYTKVDYAYPRVPVPSGFGAKAISKTSCQASWNKVEGKDVSYLVYRGNAPSGNWGSAIAVLNQNQTTYIDRNVTTGRKYYYMVRARQYVDGVAYFSDYTKVDYGYPR